MIWQRIKCAVLGHKWRGENGIAGAWDCVRCRLLRTEPNMERVGY